MTTTTSKLFCNFDTAANIGTPDEVTILFEQLFSEITMKDKNKILMLFINEHLSTNDSPILKRFLKDTAISDFSPSLLKSISIFIENVDWLNEYKPKIKNLLNLAN